MPYLYYFLLQLPSTYLYFHYLANNEGAKNFFSPTKVLVINFLMTLKFLDSMPLQGINEGKLLLCSKT